MCIYVQAVGCTCINLQDSKDPQGVSRANGSRANKTFRGAIKCIENEQWMHWFCSAGGKIP